MNGRSPIAIRPGWPAGVATAPRRSAAAMAAALALATALVTPGCSGWAAPKPPTEEPGLPPVPVQQMQTYPEAATGRFVSLVDFEPSTVPPRQGYQQAEWFSIEPAGGGSELKFVVNVTRTGTGALEALLAPGARLVFRMPDVHDFSEYTLLTLAVHSPGIRDDLKVLLSTDRAGWECPPVLLRAGWNDVRIDLERLKALPDFESRGVRAIALRFAQADGPVRIGLDDLMLVDNRRQMTPVPPGMRLTKQGLDYELSLPGGKTVYLRQCDDGLWRLGDDQMVVETFAGGSRPVPSSAPSPPREDMAPFGPRRVGEVEVLESNALRLRLANTWYFPSAAGEWASLSVRHVRWEYTFYPDGRWITDVVLNNAGGEDIPYVRLTAAMEGAWSDGLRSPARPAEALPGSARRWCFLSSFDPASRQQQDEYLAPARIQAERGGVERAPGDADGDGFDESQGCYRLAARDGRCRFRLLPQGETLTRPVVRVSGRWTGPVAVNCEGLAIRDAVRLADGSVLLVLPGTLLRPTWVEAAGQAPLPGQD